MSHTQQSNFEDMPDKNHQSNNIQIDPDRLQQIAAEQWRQAQHPSRQNNSENYPNNQPKSRWSKNAGDSFCQLVDGTLDGMTDPAPELRKAVGDFLHAPRKEVLEIGRQLSEAKNYIVNITPKQLAKDLKKETAAQMQNFSRDLKTEPGPYEIGRFLGESIDYTVLSEYIAACKALAAAKRDSI